MRFKRFHVEHAIIAILAFLILGCAGSNGPIAPAPLLSRPSAQTPASISDSPAQNSHALWGMWWIYLDAAENRFEVTPARDVAIHANIRRFLEDGLPCSNCLQIVGITPGPSGIKNVDIKISHPWADSNTYTGFDVRGIAMWNGSEVWPSSGLRTQSPSGADGYVLNADGYTTVFNPTEFPPGSGGPILTYSQGKFATSTFPDSDLNPFIDYYTDDNRHFFRAGEAVTKTWQIRMPSGGPLVLGYAVDASWNPPSVKPPVNIPDDFPLSANRIEPYRVQVTQLADLEPAVGSEATVQADIWDWQNDPGSVWIECPELWTGQRFNETSSFDGEKTTAEITVENENGASEGVYRALVGSQDSSPSAPPWDYTAYTFVDITVGPHVNHPPVAAAEADQYTAYSGEPIQFHTLSYDPDGPTDIQNYYWDFTNDGTWDLPIPDPEWVYYLPGVYHVDHRVVDKGGLSDDLEPNDLLEITIYNPCCQNPPIAIAEASALSVLVNEFVTLTSYSTDPDGDYCLQKWEWDYDGVPGYDSETGPEIKVSWQTPGIYEIQHRVTDQCDLTDELGEPITIEVIPDCCQMPPVAKFNDPPNDMISGQEIILTNESYDPESASCPVSIYWDLDEDGDFNDSTDDQVTLSWDEVGVHNVSLKAVDECFLETIYTVPVTVHVGITYDDDAYYKTLGTRYGYVSGDFEPAEAASAVDINDLDGPWDFTKLSLADVGTYRVTLSPNHAEVASFKDDFLASYEHFYKSAGIYNFLDSPVYFAEEFIGNPDRLVWVGMHEDSAVGSKNFFPTMKQEYPFWFFSIVDYTYDFPSIFTFKYNLQGYAEGTVTVPYDSGLTAFCVVLRTEISVAVPSLTGSALVYEWILDDGRIVAIVTAMNTDTETNYDPDTKQVTGIATYNALDTVGPY